VAIAICSSVSRLTTHDRECAFSRKFARTLDVRCKVLWRRLFRKRGGTWAWRRKGRVVGDGDPKDHTSPLGSLFSLVMLSWLI
jgi:hypothetical protein